MAVVLDAVGTHKVITSTGIVANTFTGLTISAGLTNSVAVFSIVYGTSNAVTFSSVTWNGVACTQIGNVSASGSGGVAWFGIVNPASGNKTFSFTPSVSVEAYVEGCSFQNVNQTGGTTTFAHFASNVVTTSVLTKTLAVTTVSGNFTCMAVMPGTPATTVFTAPSGSQIYRDATDPAGAGVNAAAAQAASTTTSTSYTAANSSSDVMLMAGFDLLAAAGAASLPPGGQSFDTPQPDRNTNTYNPQLRHWQAAARFLLIGQDTLPAGVQPGNPVYQPPLAWLVPERWAQWRTWTWSYNLNLIGKDQFPPGIFPGNPVYQPPPAWLAPERWAQWRSFAWQYNPLLHVVAQPPGVQLDETPASWLVPERFAQWRSWTGSYNLNLIGKDQLPTGDQTNYLPVGNAWRPESPQQNILATILAVVPALPPGEQVWELSPRVADPFAQWRSWTGSYNLNLIGQDQFPSRTHKSYQFRNDWQPDSPQQNLRNTLFLPAVLLPPGQQFYDRTPDPRDYWAQWHSYTVSYNINLYPGEDLFPVGGQWDDLPPRAAQRGIDFQAPNLLSTLLATPPVPLPPGKQVYERPRFFFLM